MRHFTYIVLFVYNPWIHSEGKWTAIGTFISGNNTYIDLTLIITEVVDIV